MRTPLPVCASIALLAAVPARADEPAPPRLVDHLRATSDFIDDPFAISSDGSRIAYITTDGASRSALHLAPLSGPGPRVPARELPYGSITPTRVEFLDGERVLVIERDPATHVARGQVFGPSGPARERLGPATDIAIATVSGTPAIVVYARKDGKSRSHTLVALRRSDLKPLAKKVLVEDAAGRAVLGGAPAKPLFFEDGYAVLVAQKEGAYDKAADVRHPDVEARIDAFSGRLLSERPIADPVAFVELTRSRDKHAGEGPFVRLSEDVSRLELVGDDDVVTELRLPRPLRKYDPQTLVYAPTGADPAALAGIDLSLTVDPVNAEAVKAQKADRDYLDVYHLDIKEKSLVAVARVDGEKRPTAWRLAGGRLGVLRKHKGFGRGGEDLDVFAVGAAANAKPVGPSAKGGAGGKPETTALGVPAASQAPPSPNPSKGAPPR